MSDPAADEPLLALRDLTVEFPRRDGAALRAVDGVSFEIPAGRTVGLVGESGSGKSITALSILRLLPAHGRIASGVVRYRGRDLAALDEKSLRALRGDRIAMIFQEPMTSLNPVYTIADQVSEPLRIHRKLSRREARDQAIALLSKVGIADAAERARDYPHQLSGGMRQRAMIAMALSCGPELVIADEPTTALDVTIQAQILELLASLQRELGMALLLITHDLGVVAETCEEVVVMYAGQVVERAPARALFASPRHPYTAGLLRAVPRLSSEIGRTKKLPEIPGIVPPLDQLPSGCRFQDRCADVQERCRAGSVPLTPLDGKRFVRCHFPLERAESV